MRTNRVFFVCTYLTRVLRKQNRHQQKRHERCESDLGQSLSWCERADHREGCRAIKARKTSPPFKATALDSIPTATKTSSVTTDATSTINALHAKLIVICHFRSLNFAPSEPHHLTLHMFSLLSTCSISFLDVVHNWGERQLLGLACAAVTEASQTTTLGKRLGFERKSTELTGLKQK